MYKKGYVKSRVTVLYRNQYFWAVPSKLIPFVSGKSNQLYINFNEVEFSSSHAAQRAGA